jgi:hypothetical protein
MVAIALLLTFLPIIVITFLLDMRDLRDNRHRKIAAASVEYDCFRRP